VAQQGLINHPDHRAAGQAAVDAVYPLARDHKSFPDLLEEGYEPHKTATLLLAALDPQKATFAVDITDTLELKNQALSEHASQFAQQGTMKAEMSQLAAAAGVSYGYSYAELFVRIDIR
jgi:LmbE family N-acetylglucosaminyl deacetylase